MDTMLDLLRLGGDQLVGRFRGPLNFRLLVMPTVVTIIALRAVWRDLRDGRPAFLGIWIQDPVERKRVFHGWFKDVGRIFLIAIVLDITPYVLVRGPVHLLAALLFRHTSGGHSSHVPPKKGIK